MNRKTTTKKAHLVEMPELAQHNAAYRITFGTHSISLFRLKKEKKRMKMIDVTDGNTDTCRRKSEMKVKRFGEVIKNKEEEEKHE